MTAPPQRLPGFPPFAQELAGTLTAHSQYVLYGNIRDLYLMPDARQDLPDGRRPVTLIEVIWQALRPSGYRCLILSDQVDGITVYPPSEDARAAAEQVIGRRMIGGKQTLERLRTCMARVAGAAEPPPFDADAIQPNTELDGLSVGQPHQLRAAFVIDYAARIPRGQNMLEQAERDFFLFAQKLAATAETRAGGPAGRPAGLFNPIIWLSEAERDLPAWLTVGMERVRTIAVPNPGLFDRLRAARYFAPIVTRQPDSPKADDPDVVRFARRTDDMTLHSMREIARLAADRSLPLGRIDDAIRIYRIGIDENPWLQQTVRQQIKEGEQEVPRQIHGQQTAVVKAFDILKRAALGLSGAQASSSTRPRGVLFLAGPTGVGKTELAKQLATMLFGDPDAFLRFDMSEFSASHSADRLTGAPPGYVGYEAGGELTGAIRRKPFSVVLFDEFEKADRQVFDKFLQILDDGRLTDGQGVTTYFSECMLIFTSNLGIFSTDKKTNTRTQLVFPGTEYDELERTVKKAISAHFKSELGRPELLNRFGDNIVVFDFINIPTAHKILDGQLRNVETRLAREHAIQLRLADTARRRLEDWCTHPDTLTNGGRGIGNEVEGKLINPLARFLFDQDVRHGTVHVSDIELIDGVVRLTASHQP